MRVSLSTASLAWLLPRGLAATNVFDVSRSSRITCQTENDGCAVVEGSFGSVTLQGFSEPPTGNDSVYRSSGQRDSYLEFSSCWDFDCRAECDSSCSCVNLATNEVCPTAGEIPSLPRNHPVFNLAEPHIFQNLQDIRLACTESRTKCVLSGFEGCGYTEPRYNLYNDESGLFIVDDVSKGDTSIEIRGCNPVLGSAECDAGCTCQDLATNEPCEFTALPPRPSPPVAPTAPKIVFSGLQEATFTCGVEHARCDEINGSNICGGSSSGPAGLSTTSTLQPATFRVDQVKRGANSVTFLSCSAETPFSMECDSGCTCIDANTRLPCHCTNSSMPGEACNIQEDWAARRLVGQAVGGLLVLGWFLWCFVRFSSGQKGGSSKAQDSLAYKKISREVEITSLVGGNK